MGRPASPHLQLPQQAPLDNNKNKLVIRGATNDSNPYVIGNKPEFPIWQNISLRSAATPLRYHITITQAGVVSVFLNGMPYLAGVKTTSLPPPENLYFGFAASTATFYNIHEIQDFSISIPTTPSLDLTIAANFSAPNENGTYTFTINNSGGGATSGAIQLFDNSLPEGITLNGTPMLSAPGANGATINGCNNSGSSLGTSCIISGASISNQAGNNSLQVTIPVFVSSAAINGDYSASVTGGNDSGCTSQTYSRYLCADSIARPLS